MCVFVKAFICASMSIIGSLGFVNCSTLLLFWVLTDQFKYSYFWIEVLMSWSFLYVQIRTYPKPTCSIVIDVMKMIVELVLKVWSLIILRANSILILELGLSQGSSYLHQPITYKKILTLAQVDMHLSVCFAACTNFS